MNRLKMERIDGFSAVEKEHEFLMHRFSRDVRLAEQEKEAALKELSLVRERCCESWRATIEQLISETRYRLTEEGGAVVSVEKVKAVLLDAEGRVGGIYSRLILDDDVRTRTQSGCSSVGSSMMNQSASTERGGPLIE